ncbi:hypothetical protein, partial [Halomonas sp. FME65]|uniref:hypothetical protein n=1 Tax=Halomonas sp. FME65 TaxID=2742614 RepID=UPI001D033A31
GGFCISPQYWGEVKDFAHLPPVLGGTRGKTALFWNRHDTTTRSVSPKRFARHCRLTPTNWP